MPTYASRVVILVNNDHETYTITAKSIRDYLHQAVPGIVVETINPDSSSVLNQSDVLVPLGSNLTAWAKEKYPRLPIVFGMVLNPLQSGLSNQKEEGIQITGVSLDIPVETKINQILRIIPNIKRIGLLVSDLKKDAITDNQQKEIEDLGYDAVIISVEGPQDVPGKLDQLTREADLLWMIPDSNIYNTQTVRYLIPFSIKSRLPILSLSRSYTEAGALMAVSWDFPDMGKQIGETIEKVLNGENPNSIPIAPPRNSILLVNKRTADRIGVASISTFNGVEIVQR